MEEPPQEGASKAEQAGRSGRCEKHGLRYDPSDPRGCVLCRREAGAPVQAPPSRGASRGGAAAQAPSGPPRDPAGALRNAWLVTFALVAFTALSLFFAHDAAVKLISGVVGGLGGVEEYPEGWPEDEMLEGDSGGEVEITYDEDGNPVVNRILQIPEDLREIEDENQKKVDEYRRFQDQ